MPIKPPNTAMQRYLNLAEDSGYGFDDSDIAEHIIVIEMPERFVFVLEDAVCQPSDSYFVSYFCKSHLDYPGNPLYTGELLDCLEYANNLEK